MQNRPLSPLMKEVIVVVLLMSALTAYFFPIAFDPSPATHYTWVNFHFMSILQNTTPENHFVGYSYVYQDASGVYPHYFNRYSPLTNIVLHYAFSDLSLTAKIFAIKSLFTLVFVGNTVCVYLIARLSGLNNIVSLSLMLVLSSQYYFLYPKDMAHFDQMALLGLFVQILLLMSGKKTLFFIFTIFALHLGRNFMPILTSFFYYSCCTIREKNIKYVSLFALHFISFILSFGYNVFVEMKVTGSSILDTSILNTFQRRTGILQDTLISSADWTSYARIMLDRIGNGIVLKNNSSGEGLTRVIGISAVICILSILVVEVHRLYRSCTFIAIVLPVITFFSLAKGLVFFHDYTLMWLIPMFTYVLSRGIVFGKEWIARKRWFKSGPASLKSLLLIVTGLYFVLALHLDRSLKEEKYSNGVINKIQSEAHLVKNGARVCMKDINHHALNALLPGAIYAQRDCDFILSPAGISAEK